MANELLKSCGTVITEYLEQQINKIIKHNKISGECKKIELFLFKKGGKTSQRTTEIPKLCTNE